MAKFPFYQAAFDKNAYWTGIIMWAWDFSQPNVSIGIPTANLIS
jgi:hypothetical protein